MLTMRYHCRICCCADANVGSVSDPSQRRTGRVGNRSHGFGEGTCLTRPRAGIRMHLQIRTACLPPEPPLAVHPPPARIRPQRSIIHADPSLPCGDAPLLPGVAPRRRRRPPRRRARPGAAAVARRHLPSAAPRQRPPRRRQGRDRRRGDLHRRRSRRPGTTPLQQPRSQGRTRQGVAVAARPQKEAQNPRPPSRPTSSK